MTRWVFVIALASFSCGSSTSPAESVDDVSFDEVETSDEAAVPSSEPSTASSDAATGADVTTGGDDVQQVIQLVLDDEALEPYFKLGEPGRFPLKIAGSNLPDGLVKATKPVEVVTDAGSTKQAVLVFDEISVTGSDATVRYHYDVENIKGSARLKKRDGRWELVNSRVTQR